MKSNDKEKDKMRMKFTFYSKPGCPPVQSILKMKMDAGRIYTY